MKKLIKGIAVVLLISLVAASLSACGTGNIGDDPIDDPSVKVWSAVNTEKIMQDDEEAKNKGLESKLVFNTFKGDVEAAQLLFTPGEDVSSFNFEMCDIKNSKGDTLSADLFEVYAQRYIEVSIPSSKACIAGFYPDALIPLKNYVLKRENKVKAGNNQGLWINLNVPADAVSGQYHGNAKLTVNGSDITVPVTVNIFNVEMPSEIHSTSSYYLEMSMIAKDESAPVDELVKLYYDFFVNKRANLRDIPGYRINTTYDAAKYADDVVEYVRNPMVSAYALPYKGNSNGIIDSTFCYQIIYQLAVKNKALLDGGENIDLFKKAHFYLGALIDEPTAATYDKVRACDLEIQTQKLKVANTGILDDYPEVKASLLSLRHVVTSQIVEPLYGTDTVGGVQTWCPLITHFGSEAQRQLAISRMNSNDRTGGESVWWYTCINPKNPYPSYQTDEDLLVARLKGWMQYDYDVQGFLYWSVDNWERYYQGSYMKTDIWTDPLSWEEANGDGRLVYPGSKYGVKGPISTIRLENIRESYEDYELLWLFENTVKDLNEKYGKSYDSDEILGTFYDRLYTNLFVNSGVTERDFDAVRVELLQLLDDMLNIPAGAIGILDQLTASK